MEFQYDVFLSHNAKDQPRVRRLAERLKQAGLRVWFDEWIIFPGDDIYLAIERGLEASRTMVLCLSPAALESDWVGLERSTVLFRDPANAGRRFIPLLLADCKLPDTLRRYKYVDYRQESQQAIDQLASCAPQAQSQAVSTVQQPPNTPPSTNEPRDPAPLVAILDLIATRRSFFQGDDRALAHVVKMLNHRDAGRAVIVARSMAEVAAELEKNLSRLRSTNQVPLRTALAWLVVACKDYAETYGRQTDESHLPLPHIGWGQRIEDFTRADSQFEFGSTDSFEVYKGVLTYISRSFRELMTVRERALEVVNQIAGAEPALTEQTESILSLLRRGRDYLKEASAALELSATLIERVISTSTDFQTRRTAAAALAVEQTDPTAASLLTAISKVRSPTAWTGQSPAR